MKKVRTVEWKNGRVVMLDQRLLPNREVYRIYKDPKDRFAKEFEKLCRAFAAARPTAVNLFWAIERMRRLVEANGQLSVETLRKMLEAEAIAIYREDLDANRRLSEFGAELLPSKGTVLTHCNAGGLATAGIGTALGVILAARDAGKKLSVFADETRPVLQGARLTAWELKKARAPVTVITDNMAGHFMQQGMIDAVVVGTDRTAANGDVANKIGTYAVAVLAARHGIPFYVAAPTTSIDLNCPDGSKIPIEERAADEVSHFHGKPSTPKGVKVANPAFDVTPAKLVTAIITENGVAKGGYKRNLAKLVRASGPVAPAAPRKRTKAR